MEWLGVQIVVPSEWLAEQRRIRTLDCDRQPLENERPFSAVTRHFTYHAPSVFKEMLCRVVIEPKVSITASLLLLLLLLYR